MIWRDIMSHEHYFLGSSTSSGFVTPIGELLRDTDNTVYIFKGTAGSGKSTLMKKISDAFTDKPQEIYHCSADPYSLDAVYLPESKALIIDGTAPHCIDPVYPKAVESIVDLGAYIETPKLRSARKEIVSLTDEYSGCHKRCRLCLGAVSSVIEDIEVSARSALNTEKLSSFTDKFIKRIIPKKDSKCEGRVCRKQRAAITMNGYSSYIPENGRIYLLTDDNIVAAAAFLCDAAAKITKKGYDVFISECYLSADRFIEHLSIPELDICFITSNCINSLSLERFEKHISFRRFYRSDLLTGNDALRQRIKFGKKACAEFLKESAAALIDAKTIHDKIEEHYIAAADFDGINRLAYKLISDIKSLG